MHNPDFYRQPTLPHVHTEPVLNDELPEHIGPYKVDSLLSRGGMSLLYLGSRPTDNKLLAIKVLSPQLISHQEMVNQFLEEARIIGLTNHPNIIKLYGQGEWEQGLYIAMEFIQGVSLCQFILQQSLSLKRCLDIILQVAYALLHLHTHGVIHRDLKPENILITENGQVKVIDFGIAQLLGKEATGTMADGQLIGTPSYMSPEQKKNAQHVKYSTDIYSLGVIAYELVLGKLSYGNIQLALLPKYLRAILAKALMPNANDRYQDIVDLITDISKYIKSDAHLKDRNGKDEVREIWETLGDAQTKLLPTMGPKWPELEVGIAKPKGSLLLGCIYDFFKLADQSLVVIMAESDSNLADSLLYIANLRGIIRAFIRSYVDVNDQTEFNVGEFSTQINEFLSQDMPGKHFAFTILHLEPLADQLSFVSTGYGTVWHVPSRGGSPRPLHNLSTVMGKAPHVHYFSTNDNWNVGDLLFLHSFHGLGISDDMRNEVDAKTLLCLQENLDLSAQSQAEAILTSLQSLLPNTIEEMQKIILTLQRIE